MTGNPVFKACDKTRQKQPVKTSKTFETAYCECSYYTFQRINSKGDDQAVQKCKLACAFVVHMQKNSVL